MEWRYSAAIHERATVAGWADGFERALRALIEHCTQPGNWGPAALWEGSAPLVVIQPRGSRPPFFAVHAVWGEVMFYRELAQLLGEDQPFYALRSEGLDGSAMEHRSIEAIAGYYLTEIRRARPHGPYLLGGYCIGGVIAFEMAQQLAAAGEEVALLCLFDAFNPAKPPRRYSRTKRLKLRLNSVSGQPVTKKLRYFANWATGKVNAELMNWRANLRLALNRRGGSTDLVALRVKMVLKQAGDAYKSRLYPGRITLFRAENILDGYERLPDCGWSGVAKGGIEVYDVPGGHDNIFKHPNVGDLAGKLQACIRAALADPGSVAARSDTGAPNDRQAPSRQRASGYSWKTAGSETQRVLEEAAEK
jgi:oxalate---CoA ligase